MKLRRATFLLLLFAAADPGKAAPPRLALGLGAGGGYEALKTNSTAHTFSLGWDQEVWRGIHAGAAYAFTYVAADAGDYRDHAVSAQAGYRF